MNVDDATKKELLKKQSSLLSELDQAVLTRASPVVYFPKLEEIQQIRIIRQVYASELTKTQLFKAMRDARDSTFLVNVIIRKYVKRPSTEGLSSTSVGVG